MSTFERSSFNAGKARNIILGSLSSKADSAIFSAFGVSAEVVNGRLRHDGMTADKYAAAAIRSYDEADLKSLASSLGVRIS